MATSTERAPPRAADAYLEREEEIELIARWQEDRDYAARDRVVIAHQRLVKKMASRFGAFRSAGVTATDLVAEGNIGLLIAIDKFDLSKGTRFSTYAQWWVFTRMQEYLNANAAVVKVTRSRAEARAFREISSRPEMDDDEVDTVAERVGLSGVDLRWMRAGMRPTSISMNAPISVEEGSSEEFIDWLIDERTSAGRIMDAQLAARRRSLLVQVIQSVDLDKREREILDRRWLRQEPLTLKAIAAEIGVTSERVRQIERNILTKLRRAAVRARLKPEDLLGEVIA